MLQMYDWGSHKNVETIIVASFKIMFYYCLSMSIYDLMIFVFFSIV